MKHPPLVSIIVVSYNSSSTIIETLESIKEQTYRNIELIITDDCSSDDTVKVIEEWVGQNKDTFRSTILLTAGQNTGIPSNCNRGLSSITGKFLKFVAADDLLLHNCIQVDVEEIAESMLLCTSMLAKKGKEPISAYDSPAVVSFFKLSLKQQIKRYLRRPVFLNTPSWFIKSELFDKIGKFDERFKLLEDHPFICKLLTSGYSIKYVDHPTVIYRLSPTSATVMRGATFLRDQRLCYKFYIRPYLKLSRFIDLLVIIESSIVFFLERKELNRNVIYVTIVRSRPSRIFLEGDFFKRAFRRILGLTNS